LAYTNWDKVAAEARVVLELHAQCSIAFGTFYLKAAVIGVTVPGLFGV
jgi:hypothetical protein